MVTHPTIPERHPAEATKDAFVDLGDMSMYAIGSADESNDQRDSVIPYLIVSRRV